MWNDIEVQLRSLDEAMRRRGWQRLASLLEQQEPLPAADLLRSFLSLLRAEHDAINWRLGVEALLRAGVELAAEAAPSQRSRRLGTWLWSPFRRDSQVLRVVDPHYRRRDEDAVIVLARHLSLREFPLTRFDKVHPEKADWNLISATCGALCVVGRLGLYGDHALQHWKDADARYLFAADSRPKTLKQGALDPLFHCIRERLGADGSHDELHRTNDVGNVRVDYGLVQRYPVRYRSCRLTILHCAGCTSLGTLGAVQWAAGDTRPEGQEAEKDAIPLPPGVGDDGRFEALIKVTAQHTPSPNSWQGARTELAAMTLDGQDWSPRDGRWIERGPREIALIVDADDDEKVLDVEFDGHKVNLRRGGQAYRLLVEVCRAAMANQGAIDPEALARQTEIWGRAAVDVEHVNDALNNLKSRWLKGALSSDHRRLSARVEAQRR